MSTFLVVLALVLVAAIAIFRSIEKKEAATALAAKLQIDLQNKMMEEKAQWEAINVILSAVADLGGLANASRERELQYAIWEKKVSNVRLGQVCSTNMSSYNGVGLYLTVNGQEVAYGFHVNHLCHVTLIDKVGRIYGE
jgi:hypothetical protein